MSEDDHAVQAFLEEVWEAQPTGGWGFIAWRDQGKWKQRAYDCHHSCDLPDRLPNRLQDLYFCPTLFGERKRRNAYALPTTWLHADLDETDPRELELPPTYAWETSKGRYQALWRLYKPLEPGLFEKINQRLNYAIDADRNGWGLTKVLRIPGTQSTKYGAAYPVELLWEDKQYYVPSFIWKRVKHAPLAPAQVEVPSLVLPEMTPSAVIHKHKGSLPQRALDLLAAKEAVLGERSDRLWELEKLMLKAGVSPEEVLIAVRSTVWNKFKGQRRELRQLWTEVNKAKADAKLTLTAKQSFGEKKLTEVVTSFEDFVYQSISPPGWMVEGVWSGTAHGIIAGEPKTYKSLIAMDLAVSVASGTKFLGTFPVPEQGPALIIQEENPPGLVKDRLAKIAHSRGALANASLNGNTLNINAGSALPLHVVNNYGMNLLEPEHLEALTDLIQSTGAKLVVLDPLYLMIPGADENSAHAMAPILGNLLKIKQTLDVGILIVHHYRKQSQDNPTSGGQRISGTGAFHRWVESALYVQRSTDDAYTVHITPEHRAAPPQGTITAEFYIGEFDDLTYRVDVTVTREDLRDEYGRLKSLVKEHPGIPLRKVAKVLEMDARTVKKRAEKCGLTLVQKSGNGKTGRPPTRLYFHGDE